MKGDRIIIEAHHESAAAGIVDELPRLRSPGTDRRVITIAGESGSGKSETAAALAARLADSGVAACIFQQDDYFKLPPRRNDRARRDDIGWVGPGEVRLDLLDEHLAAFRAGSGAIAKPLVDYASDSIGEELMDVSACQVAIAEGTYTSLLEQADWRVFIARTHRDTRAHREKRRRDAAELDPFIDRVLAIEHEIISSHRERADLVIGTDYSVSRPGRADA